jgi:hypothetical protein
MPDIEPDIEQWRLEKPKSKKKTRQLKALDSPGRDWELMHVRRVIAGNPNTPNQVLMRLAEDHSTYVRRTVAHNPRSPVEVLSKLALDRDIEVRLAVAENANTSEKTLGILAHDEDADVRYGLSENPHLPEWILMELSLDDNPYVRCRALRTLSMHAANRDYRSA